MANKKPTVKLDDDNFGAVLNCAVRYAVGRETYMPSLVIDFITPLIPYLGNRTLWCFDQDLTDRKYEPYEHPFGNPRIDEPGWLRFLDAVRAERTKRGETLYRSWREKS